jgi:hypothetical protein
MALMGYPVPFPVIVPMKYSAPVTILLPVLESSILAVILTKPVPSEMVRFVTPFAAHSSAIGPRISRVDVGVGVIKGVFVGEGVIVGVKVGVNVGVFVGVDVGNGCIIVEPENKFLKIPHLSGLTTLTNSCDSIPIDTSLPYIAAGDISRARNNLSGCVWSTCKP